MDPSPNINNGQLGANGSAVATAQPTPRSSLHRLLFDHTVTEYPTSSQRARYLTLAVLATIVLYYTYYTQFGVTPNILASYHMSFKFFIAIAVASNLLGAFASLAGQPDRPGRSDERRHLRGAHRRAHHGRRRSPR